MQRNIFYVIVSLFSVIFIITLGTNLAYRKKIIPDMKANFEKEINTQNYIASKQKENIQRLESELQIITEEKLKIEKQLKKRLNEEEQNKLKEQQLQAEKLATEKLAAEKARLAAEKTAKKKSSKKSKAS